MLECEGTDDTICAVLKSRWQTSKEWETEHRTDVVSFRAGHGRIARGGITMKEKRNRNAVELILTAVLGYSIGEVLTFNSFGSYVICILLVVYGMRLIGEVTDLLFEKEEKNEPGPEGGKDP